MFGIENGEIIIENHLKSLQPKRWQHLGVEIESESLSWE